jgi:tetratricopeptide (TPR) repeat protein
MIITFVKSIKDGEFNLLYYVISLLSYSLVLLSKEIGIISIIFLLLLDKLILKHSNSKIRKLIYLPYILLLLLWQYLKPSAALGYKFTFSSFLNLPFGPLTLLKGMAVYTAICLFPLNLHMGRSITIIAGFFDPWFYISILFTIIIISLFIFGMQRNKLLIFGLAWFYLPLFIQLVFNFLFARIGKEILLPENNLYFCYPGLLFAIFSTLQFSSFKEKIKKYLFPVFLCLLLFYITLTILENFNWQDEIKFYEKNIKYNQKSAFNYINYANLGFAYERAKEFKLAEENFKLSAEKSGGNPYFYNLLALFYIRNVGFDKALETLMISKKLDAKFYRTYLLLGIVYKSKGQAQEAKRNFEQAFSLRPQAPTARKYLGPLKDNE